MSDVREEKQLNWNLYLCCYTIVQSGSSKSEWTEDFSLTKNKIKLRFRRMWVELNVPPTALKCQLESPEITHQASLIIHQANGRQLAFLFFVNSIFGVDATPQNICNNSCEINYESLTCKWVARGAFCWVSMLYLTITFSKVLLAIFLVFLKTHYNEEEK